MSQNGKTYEEGLGDAWAPIQRYWREPTLERRNAIRAVLNDEGIRHEYSLGILDSHPIEPDRYTLNAALLAQPGDVDIQQNLFLGYSDNVRLYQEYFRRTPADPPELATTSSPRGYVRL